ncbi:MAG: enoyl-CoA hydratase/isomerase family protein [Acidimicrobiia bacterium]|nr:enoyl-CoA hydratase/isomerase family protein [Acidimicrobiia bacterium]
MSDRADAYSRLEHISVTVAVGVAWAVIDHPPINLWDAALTSDLVRLIAGFDSDPETRVLVVSSADPEFFVAHADVQMILDMPADSQGVPDAPAPINVLFDRLRTCPKVSIALVRGIARGGGSELALACDLRFATPTARFGQPEVALGIIPGAGGTQRLTRLVGRARALEIVLGCGDVTGSEAAAMGYVNRVLAGEEVEPFVRRLAIRIAAMPIAAVAGAKQSVDAAVGDPTEGYVAEAAAFRAALADPEARERMARFLERGGQTREVERDLGALIDGLGSAE